MSNGYIRNGNSPGEKVIIDQASFDFAKEERKFDRGLQGGTERKIGKKLAIAANLQWGLQPVFPAEFKGVGFKMYNIFAGLGVSYQL